MPVVFKLEWVEQGGVRVAVCADCKQVTNVGSVADVRSVATTMRAHRATCAGARAITKKGC